MSHDMRPQSATGFGRWMQCTKCGATQHSGYYWLGGVKSKEEPPCPERYRDPAYAKWRETAEDATRDILG